MPHLDLIGAPSAIRIQLKEMLAEYLELHNVDCEIHECEEIEEKSRNQSAGYATIKFMGHTLEFKNDSDINRKLPKLYLLMESSKSGGGNKEKKCINCDRCKCRDILKSKDSQS